MPVRRCLIVLTILLVLFQLVGCGGDTTPGPGPTPESVSRLTIVVSILPQKYFVERIGGEYVDVSVMVLPGSSPASYEPKPEQLRALSRAAAYMSIGVPFEDAWLDRIASANPDMLMVDTAQGIERVGGDPHIWLSPRLAKVQAGTIFEALAQLDPAHEAAYRANLDDFLADIDALDAEIRAKLARVRNRKFMVFHPSWGYFARDYGLEMIPIEVGGQETRAQGHVLGSPGKKVGEQRGAVVPHGLQGAVAALVQGVHQHRVGDGAGRRRHRVAQQDGQGVGSPDGLLHQGRGGTSQQIQGLLQEEGDGALPLRQGPEARRGRVAGQQLADALLDDAQGLARIALPDPQAVHLEQVAADSVEQERGVETIVGIGEGIGGGSQLRLERAQSQAFPGLSGEAGRAQAPVPVVQAQGPGPHGMELHQEVQIAFLEIGQSGGKHRVRREGHERAHGVPGHGGHGGRISTGGDSRLTPRRGFGHGSGLRQRAGDDSQPVPRNGSEQEQARGRASRLRHAVYSS